MGYRYENNLDEENERRYLVTFGILTDGVGLILRRIFLMVGGHAHIHGRALGRK